MAIILTKSTIFNLEGRIGLRKIEEYLYSGVIVAVKFEIRIMMENVGKNTEI